MKASIEQPDHTYQTQEVGEPVCGKDFCDRCGDCLVCDADTCASGSWCGGPYWVIYLFDEKNPHYKVEEVRP